MYDGVVGELLLLIRKSGLFDLSDEVVVRRIKGMQEAAGIRSANKRRTVIMTLTKIMVIIRKIIMIMQAGNVVWVVR